MRLPRDFVLYALWVIAMTKGSGFLPLPAGHKLMNDGACASYANQGTGLGMKAVVGCCLLLDSSRILRGMRGMGAFLLSPEKNNF